MVSMLLCGWNAGSLGPLLPALQSYYDVRHFAKYKLTTRSAIQKVGTHAIGQAGTNLQSP
jgi:hypothetical protein